MRVLICGGRHDRRERLAKWAFRVLLRQGRMGDVVDLVGIQGCASGWDTFARQWFLEVHCGTDNGTLLDFPIRAADWDRYGKGAGPRRNRQMLVEGRPELVIAGPGGAGTQDMMRQARAADVPVVYLRDEDWFVDGERRYRALYG